MKFYAFNDITAAGDCTVIARDVFGANVKNGHCNAAWRGGDGPENVTIDREKWFDHARKVGGGIIKLAAYKFGGDIQQSQAFLGEYYNLTPKKETGKQPRAGGRYDELIRAGWKEVERYLYTLNGFLRHFAVRLHHPGKPGEKEFVQGHLNASGAEVWGMRGIETILYRVDDIAARTWVAIVEGEKSANRLQAAGIPATTCCGGSKAWHDGLNAPLAGKSVAIFPDNDEPGRTHAEQVAAALYQVAQSVRIVPPAPGLEAKQGIDDWLDAGHTAAEIEDLITAAPEYMPSAEIIELSMDAGPTPSMLDSAKEANTVPFRNFIPSEKEVEGRGGRKRNEIVNEPRTHQALLDDLSKRFLGFPRKQGDEFLFDHDRDTGEIISIRDSDRLLAWMGRRSKKTVAWGRGDSMVTQRQFYASILATAHRYESISLIPSWPRRPDVYYAHGDLPDPCPDRSRLNKFIDFFCPSSEFDKFLLKAFVVMPLWYIPGIPRPAWVIDSAEGQGCGKTTLVEIVAQLYGHAPICTSKQELSINLQQIVKRCVSYSGRQARVLLVDNVTGILKSEELSYLITAKDITGMAPYGHGEETRPNDLTYVITSNTANVDADLAHRFMYVMVSRPEATPQRKSWKTNVLAYIQKYRLEIVSDIIAMLSEHKPFDLIPGTRFPEFEECILQPCCETPENTTATLEHLVKSRGESNIDEEQARAIVEVFQYNLEKLQLDDCPVFIRTDLANSWGRAALKESHDYKGYPIQLIRNLAKLGMITQTDPHLKRWPMTSQSDRISGIPWNFSDTTEKAFVVSRNQENEILYKEM